MDGDISDVILEAREKEESHISVTYWYRCLFWWQAALDGIHAYAQYIDWWITWPNISYIFVSIIYKSSSWNGVVELLLQISNTFKIPRSDCVRHDMWIGKCNAQAADCGLFIKTGPYPSIIYKSSKSNNVRRPVRKSG